MEGVPPGPVILECYARNLQQYIGQYYPGTIDAFDALPVVASSTSSLSLASKYLATPAIKVVFPVPAWPFKIKTS